MKSLSSASSTPNNQPMITTDLTQSKKLKELGAPQDTYFVWVKNTYNGTYFQREKVKGNAELSAYTLQELIEWLGDDFHCLTRFANKWHVDTSGTIPARTYHDETGSTPLDTVFKLAVAIKEQV